MAEPAPEYKAETPAKAEKPAETPPKEAKAEKPAEEKKILSDELSALLKPTPEMIAADYVNMFHGRLDAKLVEANAKKLIALQSVKPVSAGAADAASTAYKASGTIASLIFGMQLTVQISGGKELSAWAGGFSSPGGGTAWGSVFTDDINDLYMYTTQFSFISSPVSLSVIFYNAQNGVIGNFQSGGVSTVAGTGQGRATWQ
jgi:hypothetical protein